MNRKQRKLLNIVAISLLVFALYINFIYKEKKEVSNHQNLPNAAFVKETTIR
ncbi:MAG: hypothetical protein ACKVOW_16975 [Chitinophagaceae bacterium]